jgi:HD superfamily phosphohydrolase
MMQRSLDFLNPQARKKTVRTKLYGDQEFSLWELEVIHTPVFQRLYDLKQLGFADRVYPDAVHSRFNHVLGVAFRAEQMLQQLIVWLRTNNKIQLGYARSELENDGLAKISGEELAGLLCERVEAVRLIGLLHDLTHAAYGHTLEDEVQVFTEKHDAPVRQRRFFDSLVAQLLAIWTTECGLRNPDLGELDALRRLEVNRAATNSRAEEFRKCLDPVARKELVRLLKQLEIAILSILHIEYLHGESRPDLKDELLVRTVIEALNPEEPPPDHVIHRDAVLVDIVGNTICADLIDYARRDSSNAGLRVQFDVRLMRYMVAVSVEGDKSPDRRPCIRLAVQFFTDKMRHDVLSEMSGILKARYLISERILFHPTKCAAGAMLGTAIQLLGLTELPVWVQALGDSETLRLLNQTSVNVRSLCEGMDSQRQKKASEIAQRLWPSNQLERELAVFCLVSIVGEDVPFSEAHAQISEVLARMEAARLVLWRLAARRFPKLVFRLRSELQHSGGADAEKIAKQFSQCRFRFDLERTIETSCALPIGTVFIHCPRRKTSMKVAEALVVGPDLTQVARLRDVTDVCREGLGPYQQEIRAVEEMYGSIWQFHGYLDVSQMHKRGLVALAFAAETGFPNDTLLKSSPAGEGQANPYEILATDLVGEVAPKLMPRVIRRLDGTAPIWLASNHDPREIAIGAIRKASQEAWSAVEVSQAGTDAEPAQSLLQELTDGVKSMGDQLAHGLSSHARSSKEFSFEEFCQILQTPNAQLSRKELVLPYRTLMQHRSEGSLSWEDARVKAQRLAQSLLQAAPALDLFHGQLEDVAIAHRLPTNIRDWEKI